MGIGLAMFPMPLPEFPRPGLPLNYRVLEKGAFLSMCPPGLKGTQTHSGSGAPLRKGRQE